MNFASITDITIPQGNVVKIHETNSERVLWEKEKSLYDVKTKLDLLNGFTLDELKSLQGYSTRTYGGNIYYHAPLTVSSPYYNWNTPVIFNYYNAITQQRYIRDDVRAVWLNDSFEKNYKLRADKVKRAKWFIDYSCLPPGLVLRYYEEGQLGEMGDNLSFVWFIKEGFTTVIDSYFYTPTITIDGENLQNLWWVKVKLVTDIGYDEKYIPFQIWQGDTTYNTSSNAADYHVYFIKNSTVASDISESFNL